MKGKKSILVVLFVLLTAQIAAAYYCPSTGRWLSRDPLGEPGFETLRAASIVPKVGDSISTAPARWIQRDISSSKKEPNRYALVANRPITAIDFLGLEVTLFTWNATPCAKGKTAFIQVITAPLGSVVDDGTHGLMSQSPGCPPFYPASVNNTFADQPNLLGHNDPLLYLKTFNVCRVCLEECCGVYRSTGRKAPDISYSGYQIVSYGPCRSFTLPGNPDADGNVNLENSDRPYVYASDTPSKDFMNTLKNSFPRSGGCIECSASKANF